MRFHTKRKEDHRVDSRGNWDHRRHWKYLLRSSRVPNDPKDVGGYRAWRECFRKCPPWDLHSKLRLDFLQPIWQLCVPAIDRGMLHLRTKKFGIHTGTIYEWNVVQLAWNQSHVNSRWDPCNSFHGEPHFWERVGCHRQWVREAGVATLHA